MIQKYLYIFSEFVEHIFETLGSKWAQTERKMYKYFEYALNATTPKLNMSIFRCCGQKMPDELFRASHFHNSAPNSNIVGHAPHFYSHIGAGHKGIKPLMCKHNVVYDLLTLASYLFYLYQFDMEV